MSEESRRIVRFCGNCGSRVSLKRTFCTHCGTRIEAGTPSSSTSDLRSTQRTDSDAKQEPADDSDTDWFFPTMFDFSFTTFASVHLAKLLYVVGIIVCAVLAISALINAFAYSSNPGITSYISLITVPVQFLFSIVALRILTEIIVVVFNMADDLSVIAKGARARKKLRRRRGRDEGSTNT